MAAYPRVLVIDLPDDLLVVRSRLVPASVNAAAVTAAPALAANHVRAARVGRITAPGRVR